MRRSVLLLFAACAAPAQHEVTASGDLLTPDGELREPGWSSTMRQTWDASRVHDASALRQWDFFSWQDDRAAVNCTLVDLGFLQVASVGVVDLASGTTTTSMALLGSGDTMVLSPAVVGDASATLRTQTDPVMTFTTDATTSTIAIDLPASSFGVAATGSITITRAADLPYLSLATPFDESPYLFFYEQKLPGMRASGTLTIDGAAHTFAGAIATMDWGRGAWPKTATWHWAAGADSDAGVAFNLGNGFGDASAGTENIAFADTTTKLDTVDWTFDIDHPMAPWHFDGDDVSLTLTPVAPEVDGLDFGSVYSHVHKAYGTFTGTIAGHTVNARGFAEQEDLSW